MLDRNSEKDCSVLSEDVSNNGDQPSAAVVVHEQSAGTGVNSIMCSNE
jgi:hypothetical protein